MSVLVVGAGIGLAGPKAVANADPAVVLPVLSSDGTVDSFGRLRAGAQGDGGCGALRVPPGVTEVQVTSRGGAGTAGRARGGHGGGVGGLGSVVVVENVPVTPGQLLYTGGARGGSGNTARGFGDSDFIGDTAGSTGAGGDASWVSYAVDPATCVPQQMIAMAGGGGGGGDGDWQGPGGTGGSADQAGNSGSGSGSGRAGRGGAPGTQTGPGAGGGGGRVFDVTCFCTTEGEAGQAGTSLDSLRRDRRGYDGAEGGTGGRGLSGASNTTNGGTGGAGYHGGGGGGASHGFSDSLDGSGPLAGAGSGGGGGGSSYPRDSVVDSWEFTSSSVEVVARWASTTTVTSSGSPQQPGQPITLTATVGTVNPFGSRFLSGGTVSFRDLGPNPQPGASGSALGAAPVVVGADGRVTASLTVPALTGGTHRIDAYFDGYGQFADYDGIKEVLPSHGLFDQVVVDQQTISFTSSPQSPAAYGDPYPVSARSTSGLPVTVTVDPSAATVCSLDRANGSVSFIGTGTCVLNADQAGSPAFFPAARVQQSFAVATGTPPVQQVITFTSTPPDSPRPGAVYTVSAVGGASGNPVVFRVEDVGFGSCGQYELPNNQVRIYAGGPCRIVATQAGGRGYLAASAAQEFSIPKSTQDIEFRTTPPSALATGQTYTAVVAVSSARLATFGTGPGSSGCTVVRTPPNLTLGNATTSATVTATGPGTCVVTAQEPTDDIYWSPSPVITQSFPVGPQQTVTFTSAPPSSAVVGGQYTPTTSGGSSGQPVVLGTTTPFTCAISDGTVRLVGAGVCTLTADQAGTSAVAAAPRAYQSLVVGRGSQTLAFTSGAPGSAVVGQTYAPVVTGSLSSAPLVVGSTTPATCTSDGTTLTFTGAGNCLVTADQAGDLNVTAADRVTQTVTVGRAAQAVSFRSTAPATATVGGTAYTPVVTGGPSTAPVVLGTTTPAVCAVSGSSVSFTAAGTCTITADQAGDVNYTAAARVSQDVTVGPGAQSVAFRSTPPAGTVGGATYTPVVTAGPSTAPVVLGTTTPAVCTVAGASVSFTTAGTCTVTADQAGDVNYAAAPRVTQHVTVGPGAQTVAFSSTPPTGAVVGQTYTPVTTAGPSTAPVVLGTTSPAVCTVTGSTVSFTGTGDCILTADQAGDGNYTAAQQVTQTVPVGKAPQTITVTTTPPGAPTTGVAYPVAATSTSGLPVSFTGAGPCVVAPTGAGTATVTLSGTGSCTVTSAQAGDATRSAATPVTQTYQVGATGSADLRVTVTPGSGIRSAGPQEITVTVANTGARDSGAATTQLVVTAKVTDTGGAARTGGLFGSSVLTWTAPNVAAGQSVTYTVRVDPGVGLGLLGAFTRGGVPDATPLDNVAVAGFVYTPATPTATTTVPPTVTAGSVPTSTTPAPASAPSTSTRASTTGGSETTSSRATTTGDPQP